MQIDCDMKMDNLNIVFTRLDKLIEYTEKQYESISEYFDTVQLKIDYIK